MASSEPGPRKDDRDERLAAALRENLKRRKAQARSLQDKDKSSPSNNPPSNNPEDKTGG